VKLLRHSLLRQGLTGPEAQGDDGMTQRGIYLHACRERALESHGRHTVRQLHGIEILHDAALAREFALAY
jgi:hypothetical protein